MAFEPIHFPHEDESGANRTGGKRTPPRRLLLLGGLVTLAVVAGAVALLFMLLQDRERELLQTLENRVGIIAEGNAKVLATWLDGRAELAHRLTENHLFKLFATEMESAAEGSPLAGALEEQLPYMQAAVSEFADHNQLVGVYLLGPSGRAFLASAGAPRLTERQRAAAQHYPAGAERHVLPLHAAAGRLLLDMLLPVQAPQTSGGKPPAIAGYLLLTVPADARLQELLAPGPLADAGERARLVQTNVGEPMEVRPGDTPPLQSVPPASWRMEGARLPFGQRVAFDEKRAVFSAGLRVGSTPWWLVQEYDRDAALEPLETFRAVGIGVTALFVLLVIAAMVAVWWWQMGEKSRALADQYRAMAAEIRAQQRLLESINSAISEQISLKDASRRYNYANPAFLAATGESLASLLGQQDEQIYPPALARQLLQLDERVLHGRPVVNVQLPVEQDGRRRFVQLSKTLLQDEAGQPAGIVTVGRDVTEQILHQKERERSIRQTVAALDHTIAMVDPYLRGHSARVKELALGVARLLKAPAEIGNALDIAAELCQVGKLAVPRELLTAERRLSPDEMAVMQRHIEYAEQVLGKIDFRLPVTQIVTEMHERLDGSGYPYAKKGAAISLGGRILGVCDYFVARSSPRSYRDPTPPAKVVAVLRAHPEQFDRRVVEALAQYLKHAARKPRPLAAPTA